MKFDPGFAKAGWTMASDNGAHSGSSWQIPGGSRTHGGSPEAESFLIIFKQKRGQQLRIYFNFEVIARPRV